MDDKVEKLKMLENEMEDIVADSNAAASKVRSQQKYVEELEQRLQEARNELVERIGIAKKYNIQIAVKANEIKETMKIHTANFYLQYLK